MKPITKTYNLYIQGENSTPGSITTYYTSCEYNGVNKPFYFSNGNPETIHLQWPPDDRQFRDENNRSIIEKLKQDNPTLWEKIKSFFKRKN